MNLIYGAIQQYRQKHGMLPRWLSDLVPDPLADPRVLVCPFVQNFGYLKEWRKDFVTVPVFGDPGDCSYSYELCLEPFRWVPGWTTRDYKEHQMQLLGLGVPIVRCFAHRPILNLGFDGSIYPSPSEWEDNFVTDPKHRSALHSVHWLATNTPNQTALLITAPRPPEAGAGQIDLSPHYNATLFHLSQVDSSGQVIRACPEGLQPIGNVRFDIRGLVHLAGKNFPIPFPRSVQNIGIHSRCATLYLLHGTCLTAPEGEVIAKYVLHHENGTTEIPIAYGEAVRTRWFDPKRKAESRQPTPAWVSPPERVATISKALRLYVHRWANPNPGASVHTLDFESLMTESAPFLVAITVE